MSSAETAAPERSEPADALARLIARPIAHRGFHDAALGVPENSLAAARRAAAFGYGIECDVRLSHEGTPFVFHDQLVGRLCAVEGDFDRLSDAEIGGLRLLGTDESPPRLADLCRAAGPQAPLLVEIKSQVGVDPARCVAAVEKALAEHPGPIGLMSFDPALVEAALSLADRFAVGATTLGSHATVAALMESLLGRGLRFLSHDARALPDPQFRNLCDRHQLRLLTWTIRSKGEADRLCGEMDQITFEHFQP